MSDIEWTDETWNPVTGCTQISPGCENCYALRMSHRLKAMGVANYRNGFELTTHDHVLAASLGSELLDNTLPLGGSRGTSGEGCWRRPRRALSLEPCRATDSPLRNHQEAANRRWRSFPFWRVEAPSPPAPPFTPDMGGAPDQKVLRAISLGHCREKHWPQFHWPQFHWPQFHSGPNSTLAPIPLRRYRRRWPKRSGCGTPRRSRHAKAADSRVRSGGLVIANPKRFRTSASIIVVFMFL